MSDEADINKMVVEFVNQNIDRFYLTGKGILKGTADKMRLANFNRRLANESRSEVVGSALTELSSTHGHGD